MRASGKGWARARRGRSWAVGFCLLVGLLLAVPASASAYLYWSNPTHQAIGRANLDGSGVNQHFIATASKPEGIAVDASYIYWATQTGTIGRAKLDGSEVNQSFIAVPPPPVFAFSYLDGLAVDDSHIYWSAPGDRLIGRAKLDGTEVESEFLDLAPSQPFGIAVDADHLYWAGNRFTGSDFVLGLGRANLDGSEVEPEFITTANHSIRLALNASHIYWMPEISIGPPFGAPLGRANLNGSEVNDFLVANVNAGGGLALSDSHVYWVNLSAGLIGRASLDGSLVEPELVTGLETIANQGEEHVAAAVDGGYSPVPLEEPVIPSDSGSQSSQPPSASNASPATTALPAKTKPTSRHRKPVKCRKGFKKRKVRGKVKCVRSKPARRHQAGRPSATASRIPGEAGCLEAGLARPTVVQPLTMHHAGLRPQTPKHWHSQGTSGWFQVAPLSEGCASVSRVVSGQIQMRQRAAWVNVLAQNNKVSWKGSEFFRLSASPTHAWPSYVFNECDAKGHWQKTRGIVTVAVKDTASREVFGSRRYVFPVKVHGSCKLARYSKMVAG